MDTPRKRPRQQRSRATVDTVLEAAAQVFEREGMAATTNRIAERAGFSIGTLYHAEATAALAAHVHRCGVAPAGTGDAGPGGAREQTHRTAALLVQTAEVTLHRVVLADTAACADELAARLAETLLALVPAPTR